MGVERANSTRNRGRTRDTWRVMRREKEEIAIVRCGQA